MKKALVVVLFVVMGLTTLSIGSAMAGYYTCTVSQVGSAGTFYMLTLTDTAATPAFTNTGFVIDAATTGANSMLAAALTAYSIGGKLQVWLNSIGAGSNIFSAVCTN